MSQKEWTYTSLYKFFKWTYTPLRRYCIEKNFTIHTFTGSFLRLLRAESGCFWNLRDIWDNITQLWIFLSCLLVYDSWKKYTKKNKFQCQTNLTEFIIHSTSIVGLSFWGSNVKVYICSQNIWLYFQDYNSAFQNFSLHYYTCCY